MAAMPARVIVTRGEYRRVGRRVAVSYARFAGYAAVRPGP
jgi:hypothetical protein